MKTKDLQRAYYWSEKNHNHDLLAKYYFNVCLTLGTFSEFDFNISKKLNISAYKHLCVNDELCELRDLVAKEILVKIKGQKI